jgi:glycosyltransferase involved in cell wall biosynthesis
MRHWIKVHSTHVLAVSNLAASAVLGRGALLRGGYTRLTGIDLSSFQAAIDRGAVRDKLGIEPQALAVGHIGSFRTQKNHRFIVQVADELRRVDTRARIVLIGEGPLKDAIASEVRSRGLSGMFRFAGEWPEISKALRAMDAFVFPSLYEGLPRALLEAQAAGLPCIASDRITDEVSAWPGRVTFLPIGAGAAAWAHSLVKALSSERDPMLGPRTIQALDELGFSIGANAATLETLYLKDKLVV